MTSAPSPSRLLPLEEALTLLEPHFPAVTETQSLPLAQALHRVLAEDVIAPMNVPPHDNSAVDGWGFAAGSRPARGAPLALAGTVAAGHPFSGEVPAGTAVRILTGAPVPAGVDTIAMQEDCQNTPEGITIPATIPMGSNIRSAGEDVRRDSTVLTKGVRLRPQDLGIAAAVGRTHVMVYRPLRVAIFSTGDEIRDPGEPLPPGCIYDTNRTTALSLLRGLGCEVTDLGILADKHAVVTEAIAAAASDHDVILTSGGVSVGDEDHVKAAVESVGTLHFWRLAIKPGKPVAMGSVKGTAFIGLPGNPVAVLVTLMMVARPLLLRKMGMLDVSTPKLPAVSGFTLRRKAGRREWLRARMEIEDGRLMIKTFTTESSGVLSSMVWSDGLVEIPESVSDVALGHPLMYIPYSELLR